MNNFSLWNIAHGASLMDIMYKGGNVGANVANKSRLPDGYYEIPYLENLSNTYPTYIVLDHNFNSTHSKLTINYQTPAYAGRRIAGCKSDGTRGKGFDLSSTGYYFGDYYTGKSAINEFIKVEIGEQALYIDGELISTFTKQVDNTCPNNLAIGVCYGSGTSLLATNGCHRIGEVIVEYDGEKLFHLVPCIEEENEVVGFYDLVNETFRRSESGYDWGVGGTMMLDITDDILYAE